MLLEGRFSWYRFGLGAVHGRFGVGVGSGLELLRVSQKVGLGSGSREALDHNTGPHPGLAYPFVSCCGAHGGPFLLFLGGCRAPKL